MSCADFRLRFGQSVSCAEFSPDLAQIWPECADFSPGLCQIWPECADFSPDLAQVGSDWSDLLRVDSGGGFVGVELTELKPLLKRDFTQRH